MEILNSVPGELFLVKHVPLGWFAKVPHVWQFG